MKVGIISFAHMHAHAYTEALKHIPDVELSIISDENEERGMIASDKFDVPYVSDYHDLLDTDVDAVIVCAENAQHARIVVAAAQAKKHVLCEKPIATTVEDAVRMVEACEEHGTILQIAFPVRFQPSIRRVKALIDEGKLGRILAIRGTNRGQNPGGWFVDPELSGGGAVMDHTVHVIDLMRWFTGSEVREVYAEIDTHFNQDLRVDDCGLLVFDFENGVVASHDPSWSRCKTYPTWGDVTLEVIGTDGVVEVDAFAQAMTLHSDTLGHATYQNWGDDMDQLLVADFVHSVRAKQDASVTGEDGLRALEVALAAYRSADTKSPVKLARR
ncbi:Gfo/Idh/MocA family protein [Alicyclobacillus dauci]|uniref:Gfo/Idh/MocA family oxidoreductase n=1 Tax=Alicyclobacillus dauci TaxID=1475485 RepID=A0ABY6YY74_9BACL|nr:Gfo/Idh/MocA family oxidoreductase [Alicyclobacillus dauci]WAH35569.1 Gfo/Idh/MocA family oxidoreductase [Alicyclobacillus dauci]